MKLSLSWRFSIRGEAVFWIVSLIFISAGILFLYGIPKIIFSERETCTEKTSGRVIELEQRGNIFYPVIEFTDGQGNTRRIKQSSGSSLPVFKENDSVEILYDPSDPVKIFIPGEYHELLYVFKLTGYIFLVLGSVILLMTLPSVVIKIVSPQNTGVWFWWVNFTGGMMGALLFSVPSSFIWLIYIFLPENIQSAFLEKSFLPWIFTAAGIIVNIGIFFVARSQLRGRPLWKKS